MKLLNMKLENFQGIESFEMNPDGKSTDVYGQNGTGKTTLYNAYHWLLFNRPGTDEKNYSPRTEGSTGKNHSVEITFEHDSKQINLKKSLHMTGKSSKTEYFVDELKVKQKDYEKFLSDICQPESMKLLTKDDAFLANTPVQDRRNALFEKFGGVDADAVIQSDKKLEKLPEILNGKEVTTYIKIAKDKIKTLKKESDSIPARIEEIRHNLPILDGTKEDYEKKLQDLKEKQKELNAKLNAGQDERAAEIRKRIAELEAQKSQEEVAYQTGTIAEVNRINAEIGKLQKQRNEHRSELYRLKGERDRLLADIEQMQKDRKALVAKWQEENAREFSTDGKCPYCGQDLPVEKIEEARKAFNVEKSNRLEEISKSGAKVSKKVIAEMQEDVSKHEETIACTEERIKAIDREIVIRQDKNSHIPAFSDTEKCKELTERIEEQKEKLQEVSCSENANSSEITEQILEPEKEYEATVEKIVSFNAIEESKQRIKELEELEKKAVAESEEYEYGVYLCKLFNRKKAELMEEKINSSFENLKFRLFRELANGEIEDDCEALVNCKEGWIPYSKANHAAKVRAGLEMIEALSKYFGVSFPVWIDNAESITSKFPETSYQQIRLFAKEGEEELRCEYV